MLRPDRRSAMFALYAFARSMDDVADGNVGDALKQIASYRNWIEGCYAANQGPKVNIQADNFNIQADRVNIQADDDPCIQLEPVRLALQDTIQRFQLPREVFLSLLDGIEFDLQPNVQIPARVDMERYCHQVATSVGLGCLHIWGADVESCRASASACGLAFQTTNILRDIAEDAERGRIYLPLESLCQYGISPHRWLAKDPDGDWKALIREYGELTRHWYAEAWSLIDYLPRDGQRMFSLMCGAMRDCSSKLSSPSINSGRDEFAWDASRSLRWRVRTSLRRGTVDCHLLHWPLMSDNPPMNKRRGMACE